MLPLSAITKSAIILHYIPAYNDVYLGVDHELEKVLKEALEKNNVVVNDSLNNETSLNESLIVADNLLREVENPNINALRCIILMLR